MGLRDDPESRFVAVGVRATLSFVGDWNRNKTALTATAPAAGHTVMADAIEQFCDGWGYGFGNIADEFEEIAQALVTAMSRNPQSRLSQPVSTIGIPIQMSWWIRHHTERFVWMAASSPPCDLRPQESTHRLRSHRASGPGSTVAESTDPV